MMIRIAGTVNDSIVDGPGFRFSVFAQGCRHHCIGCHNPNTHDFAGGEIVDTDELIACMAHNPLLDGLTLTGGDPFEQPEACARLAEGARALGLTVWAYTGYTWDELMEDPKKIGLVQACDVVVDGRFDLGQRTLDLRFRGSKNQRLIDAQQSLLTGRVVEFPLA